MKTEPTTVPQSAMDYRRKRSLAAILILVTALFSGTVMGVMLATHFSEPEAPPDSPTLVTLREQLAADPDNPDLKQTLRAEDVRLRRQNLRHRRRFRLGAWLLLIGVGLVVVCAKWHASLDPATPIPSTPADRQDADSWLGRRRRALTAVACLAAAVLAVLLVTAFIGGAPLPEPGWEPPSPAPSPDDPAVTGRTPIDRRLYEKNWPGFRGPFGMGVVKAGEWPDAFDAATGENILWKTPVSAPGNSSPIVWGDRVFLTGGTAELQQLLCFDRDGGGLLWRAVISAPRRGDLELDIMDETGHAAPTPATDGTNVYVTYASADTAAVDFHGNVVWARNLGKPHNVYGRAASLLVHKGTVIVQFDRGSSPNEGLSSLLALSTKTGDTVWNTPRAVANSWSTPVVIETPSRPELITCGAPWVIAYDPASGGELWRARELTGDVAPAPVFAGGLIFVTNEYARVMAIRPGGTGDVTESHVAWTADDGMSDAPSPLATDDFFLQVHSTGRITCYDAKKGTLLWEHFLRLKSGRGVWASPTLVGDRVYLPAEDGKVFIFDLADAFKLYAVRDLGEPLYATPAFVDGQIFMRGKNHLFCIGSGEE